MKMSGFPHKGSGSSRRGWDTGTIPQKDLAPCPARESRAGLLTGNGASHGRHWALGLDTELGELG